MNAEVQVKVTQVNPVRTDITIDRAERSNALDPATVTALTNAVLAAYEDETKLLVLRGSGKNFCAGFDTSQGGFAAEGRSARILAIEALLQLVWSGPFVSVAMAHGAAIGAGADMVASCDYRLCSRSTQLRFPGFRFTGVTLGTGRLARIVGDHHALDLVLRAQKIGIQQAAELGLATHVLDDEEQEKFVAELSEELADVSKNSIVALKGAVRAPDKWQSMSRIPMSLRG